MCEEKKALKERLGAIMKSKKHTRIAIVLSAVLIITACGTAVALVAGRVATQENNVPNISEISIDSLVLGANPGVGVLLAYESDNFIIFYGDFGLFGYNLESREIAFSVDFVKSNGKAGSVQGSHGIAVDVSSNGQTIMLYDYDVETETRGEVCYIDVPTLTYHRGEYRPMDSIFSRDSAVGYIMTTTKRGSLYYSRGDNEWLLFENYAASQYGHGALYFPDVPDIVLAYANEYITQEIAYYETDVGYPIIDSKITDLSKISTGTTGLIHNVEMWRLEYRLLPDSSDDVMLVGDMQMDGDWITEWGSTGQPLLVVMSYIEDDSWERLGITNTLTVTEEFSGDYTAATMDMFNSFKAETEDILNAVKLTLYPGVPADPKEAAPIAKDAAGWYPLDYVISAIVTCPWDADITLCFAEAGTDATTIPMPFPIEKIDTHMLRIDVGDIFPTGFLGHVWVVAIDADGIEHTTEIINVIYEPTSSMSLIGTDIEPGAMLVFSNVYDSLIELHNLLEQSDDAIEEYLSNHPHYSMNRLLTRADIVSLFDLIDRSQFPFIEGVNIEQVIVVPEAERVYSHFVVDGISYGFTAECGVDNVKEIIAIEEAAGRIELFYTGENTSLFYMKSHDLPDDDLIPFIMDVNGVYVHILVKGAYDLQTATDGISAFGFDSFG